MRNLKFIILTFISVLSFTACEKDDDLEFIANEAEDLVFNTSFLDNYVLNSTVSNNLAERFTWNSANFGVPTNITYYLQGATTADFSDYVAGDNLYDLGNNIANPEANEIPVTVGQMIALAEAAGLDSDPDSSEPNTGMAYFRLMAVIGNDGLPSYSSIQGLNIELQEQTSTVGGIMPATWGVIGSGYNDWGNAGADGQFYTTADSDVFVAYLTLIDGEIKFRENNEWVNDFGDTDADGTLDSGGDNIAVTAGTYKITLNIANGTYSLETFSWGVIGSGYNDWGNAGPDAKFYYDYTTDTFKVGVQLVDGEIKFRQNNEWVTDFGDSGADGTLDGGGDNIAVTEGHYDITLNFNDNTYSIVASDVWGVIGSGFNDWGNAGPDFSLTQISPNVFVGDIATFVDGEIKFRANNEWSMDFGDTGADGTIDAGGDNIAVTAGLYRVRLDIMNGTYMLNKIQ